MASIEGVRNQVRATVTDAVFLQTLLAFAAYATTDWLTRRAALLSLPAAARSWLLGSIVRDRPLYAVATMVLVAFFARSALGRSWHTLDRYRAVRLLAMVLVVWMTLRQVTAPRDFVLGQTYVIDRVGLVALAAAVMRFPAAIPLFVLQYRVFEAPVRAITALTSSFNIDAVAVMAVVAIAAVLASAAARRSTSSTPLVSLLGALVAAHFFESGIGKVKLGWLAHNNLANVPLNGYAQGWLGDGGGGFAHRLADFLGRVNRPLLVATLLIEVGAVVLIARRRLLIVGLVAWLLFHAFVFAAMGFVFVDWAIVETGLLALLVGAAGRTWSKPAFAKGPALVAVLAVLAGSVLFRPPRLAWFDGPAAYRYELDVIDTEGQSWVLMPDDLGSYGPPFSFGMVGLGPSTPVVAGYGAWNGSNRSALDAVATIEDLGRVEEPLAKVNEQWLDILRNFLASTCQPRSRFDALPGPVSHFVLQRDGRRYNHRLPLVSLSIRRVTTFRTPKGELTRTEAVRTLQAVHC
jgi:hypothetical protein